MNNFWKYIVFIGLLFQLNFAYCANRSTTLIFTKENSSKFAKKHISLYSFVLPNVERGTPVIKHNNRILVGLQLNSIYFQSLFILNNNALETTLTNEDINKSYKVSVLLFPFHYHW